MESSLKRNEEKKYKRISGLHESRCRKFVILISYIRSGVYRKRKMDALTRALHTRRIFREIEVR